MGTSTILFGMIVVASEKSNCLQTYGSATVNGGAFNEASVLAASVTGGSSNIASGVASSVSGGYADGAAASYDWRAGSCYYCDD